MAGVLCFWRTLLGPSGMACCDKVPWVPEDGKLEKWTLEGHSGSGNRDLSK
jgi:hypothetical protein